MIALLYRNDTRFLSKTQLIIINQSNAGRFDPKVFVNCVQDIIISDSMILLYNSALKNHCDSFDALSHSIIRRHTRDIYLGICPVQNGVSYLNVLARFGETSRTAAKKNN